MNTLHASAFGRTAPRRGGALLVVLASLAVLSVVAGNIIVNILSRQRSTHQAASWSEALTVAETGGDIGLAALNGSIADPATAWQGWSQPDANGTRTYTSTALTHAGEGATKDYVSVTATPIIVGGRTWYQFRSRGTVEVPGPGILGYEGAVRDTTGQKAARGTLRKLDFTTDRTGGVLRLPQVSRTVEVVASPPGSSMFARSLVTESWISMSGGGWTDSFDSTNPAKSTNGKYDVAKRQSNGDIATNAMGTLTNLRSTFVYGDAASNGGAMLNTTHVQGQIFNNFQITLPPVPKPTWAVVLPTPLLIKNPGAPVILPGGPQGAPARYKLSELTISSDTKPLIWDTHAPGQESYVEVWVTGKLTTSGSGFIEQKPGVHVTYFVEGDVTVSGAALVNDSERASYLLVNGVTPSSTTQKKYTVSGGANFTGVIYAPAFDLTISGDGDFNGAVVAKTASITGAASFHYDESLAGGGSSEFPAYSVVSWVEDIR